ncbi:MAG: alkaline phosphatase family protein, partial [Bacteroidota bacterium]
MIPGASFTRPRYDSGGFADLPRRIRASFASGEYDAVVLFLVDGFGWRFVQRFQDAPFLKRLARLGTVEKLTSQFPSTTASHLTTIHTGMPVGRSGVYEWFYYEPRVDAIIAPLLFSYAGDRERDTLRSSGVDAARLLPSGDFYPGLSGSGVRSYVFGGSEYTPSTYSSAVMKGAQMLGFRTLPEALVNLARLLENHSVPAYVHFYFDKIDAVCHSYGPEAPQTEAEIESFLLLMERFFDRLFDPGRRVLFLMTADHGASEVDPKTTIYLNTDPRFAGLDRFFRRNARGELLVPAGSPRDMFLYIRSELLDEAQAFLSARLHGRAEV